MANAINKESRFPSFAFGENRLRSTACNGRTAPLVPLASLDSPNRGRRVACGSSASVEHFQVTHDPGDQLGAGDDRGLAEDVLQV